MTSQRFTINQGEKVLVIGCKESDFNIWLDRHPIIKERVVIIEEDKLHRMDSIPAGIKGILSCRHINHSDSGRVASLAATQGILFKRFFPRTGELKLFLETSVIIPRKDQITEKIPEPIVAQKPETPETITAISEPRKPKRGEVKDLILKFANFEVKNAKEEIRRLLQFAKESGLNTTLNSVEVQFYSIRKKNAGLGETSTPKKKKERDDSIQTLQKYLESISEFYNNSLVAGVAVKELIEKIQNLETEKNSTDERCEMLKKENDRLKKENEHLKKDFRKKLAAFAKNL